MKDERLIYFVLKNNNLLNRQNDLLDIGYIGLAKGLTNYNKKKQSKSTYLYRCIQNEIFDEIKRENTSKRKGIVISVDEKDLENMPCEVDLEQMALDKERNKDLYQKLFKLPIIEQYVVYQTYFKNKSKYEIATRLEITITKVKKIQKKAIKKLKNMYDKESL